MSNIAVITDSNSGITQQQAEELGIFVLPMPFMIDGEEYFEGINLTVEEFFEKLKSDKEISTSQPTPESVLSLWDRLLNEGYDEIVHIPMSSGLSSSCQTAIVLADDYDGRVQVVNNREYRLHRDNPFWMPFILRKPENLQWKSGKFWKKKSWKQVFILCWIP